MKNSHITIHTDGSCKGNPGPGGYGAVIRHHENGAEIEKRSLSGGAASTTNNRMEMTAALQGLRQIKRDETTPITVISDSQILIRGMNEWITNWQAKGWRKAKGKGVINDDIWKELLEVSKGLNVQWKWVRGHDGDACNEEAHDLAYAAARKAT
ncbi:ribonuclease HI [Phaeobacter gallaeciensis]|uniref:Ribonuclease H n=2 Tax=Phaeobacter gallaeciensis TaxID=60890 RepID=A0A366X2U8_9RHOB|nr:ribonuclease HI [Phaeobacter gallaeciensis]